MPFSSPDESLVIKVSRSPAKENRSASPIPIVRITTKDYVPHSTIQLSSSTKVENNNNNNKHLLKDTKSNVKAPSVLRPRAVLSSPVNDGIIGSRNKKTNEKSSAFKMHDKEDKKKPAQSKLIIPIEGETKRPLKAIKSPEKALGTTSDQKQRKANEPVIRRQRAKLGVGKLGSI